MAEQVKAIAVSVQRFADVGPGLWWFVHHPDGFLIEIGTDAWRAEQVATEINAGRASLDLATDALADALDECDPAGRIRASLATGAEG